MKYQFPHINHINDVLPAIEDCKHFIVAEKEGYTVVNYVVADQDTFPPVTLPALNTEGTVEQLGAAIRRECRGITFCQESGKIIARKFHKFFNINEKDETQIHNIDIAQPHIILEKLDGSMIVPMQIGPDPQMIRWTTKMGITDVGMNAEAFAAARPNYFEFARYCIVNGISPIFEWCSRQNQIVIDYPEEHLTLLAMRKMVTGEYIEYKHLKEHAAMYDIPVVGSVDSDMTDQQSLQDFRDGVQNIEGEEGFIIMFNDGHMTKLKGEWYCQLHKAKELIGNERNVVSLILDNNLDDVKPFLDKDNLEKINKFEVLFNGHTSALASRYAQQIGKLMLQAEDRKDFALHYKNQLPAAVQQIAFKMYDDNSLIVHDYIRLAIKKHLTTNTKYDIIKAQFNIPSINE